MPSSAWDSLDSFLVDQEGEKAQEIHEDVLQCGDEEYEEAPEIHELFSFYDETFFFSSLKAVEVRWSSRMTLCAGTCTYHRGGYCCIRLSEPLLKYRSVKELKETLLHEMIHAYLFVTHHISNQSDHGPEFRLHMNRINEITGLNITIYHTFKNEVNYYRRHIWRCNGPCRLRPPFFGFVKRSINRAPSHHDFWWDDHQKMCGGQYQKMASPEATQVLHSTEKNSSDQKRKLKEKNSQKEVHLDPHDLLENHGKIVALKQGKQRRY